MNVDSLIQQHPCLTMPRDIVDLCQPLRLLNITYFAHVVVHQTGEVTAISNTPDYLEAYFKNQFFNLDLHTEVNIEKMGYVHWDFLPQTQELAFYHQTNKELKLNQLFTLVRPEQESIHLYHFATSEPNSRMNTFYLEQRELLEKFVTYYREELAKNSTLMQAHALPMPVKELAAHSHLLELPLTALSEVTVKNFLEGIHQSSKRIDLTILSQRELQCLELLAHGHTAKTIGQHLELSPKTVYFYLDNIKKKISGHSKADLTQYYWQQNKNV